MGDRTLGPATISNDRLRDSQREAYERTVRELRDIDAVDESVGRTATRSATTSGSASNTIIGLEPTDS